MRRVFLTLACLAMLGVAGQANAGQLNAYAPPLVWGSPSNLPATLGPVNMTVSYTAVGKTKVLGEITYCDGTGNLVSKEFYGSITIRTGNCVHQPWVRFKGMPLGTAVRVTHSP